MNEVHAKGEAFIPQKVTSSPTSKQKFLHFFLFLLCPLGSGSSRQKPMWIHADPDVSLFSFSIDVDGSPGYVQKYDAQSNISRKFTIIGPDIRNYRYLGILRNKIFY
jgi:hypothetical protein